MDAAGGRDCGVDLGSGQDRGDGAMRWIAWLWDDPPIDPFPEVIEVRGVAVVNFIRALRAKGKL